MKKLFITIAFVAAAMFAQAQFFIGGSLGLGTLSGTTTTETAGVSTSSDMPKIFNFTIAPEFGYMFNEKMGVGLELDYIYGKRTSKTGVGTATATTTTIKGSTIGFKPYFRYVFAEVDNFRFYADAYIAYSSLKPSITNESGGVSTSANGPQMTNFSIGIQPGLAYMLTDNISMNCKLNLLAIAYRSNKVVTESTTGGTTTKTTNTESGFDFGVNGFAFEGPMDDTGTFIGTTFYKDSPISIGFYYTF